MILAYVGNFEVETSSETVWARAFNRLGHSVLRIPHSVAGEHGEDTYLALLEARPDVVFYSRTHNDTALKAPWTERWRALEEKGTLTCSLHLDLFWGLTEEREGWITGDPQDPLFTTSLVCTPDGGHDAEWKAAGVNHRWLPPAIDREYAYRGEPVGDALSSVTFVGARGYHPSYPERPKLLDAAEGRWGDWFRFFNGPLGHDLNPYVASAQVILGDSCFSLNADRRIAGYWSGRVVETLGRGGLLVHPYVAGLADFHPAVIQPLPTDPSVDGLLDRVDDLLGMTAAERDLWRREGYEDTLANHTNDARAVQVLNWLKEMR